MKKSIIFKRKTIMQPLSLVVVLIFLTAVLLPVQKAGASNFRVKSLECVPLTSASNATASASASSRSSSPATSDTDTLRPRIQVINDMPSKDDLFLTYSKESKKSKKSKSSASSSKSPASTPDKPSDPAANNAGSSPATSGPDSQEYLRQQRDAMLASLSNSQNNTSASSASNASASASTGSRSSSPATSVAERSTAKTSSTPAANTSNNRTTTTATTSASTSSTYPALNIDTKYLDPAHVVGQMTFNPPGWKGAEYLLVAYSEKVGGTVPDDFYFISVKYGYQPARNDAGEEITYPYKLLNFEYITDSKSVVVGVNANAKQHERGGYVSFFGLSEWYEEFFDDKKNIPLTEEAFDFILGLCRKGQYTATVVPQK
jgi:hypothetical protein